jgi:hypothetical protein
MVPRFLGLGHERGPVDHASIVEGVGLYRVFFLAFETANGQRGVIGVDDFELTVALATSAITTGYFHVEPPKEP